MNMRKIIAVLAAVMMLCTVIPMSVFAAPGDVILQGNFDDANALFNGNVTIEDGVLHWDASTASWDHLTQGINLTANTDYVVNFKMKSNLTNGLSVKFMLHDWATLVAGETVTPTTEWAEYSVVLNSGDNTSILFMMQTNVEASAGQHFYIDDFSIVEKAEELEVGVVKNGDFENGSEGWTLNSSASVVDGVLQLDNSGIWSEAAMANIAVEVGTEYTLSWKSQRVSGSGAFLMFILNSDNSNHATTSGQNWMNSTSTDWVEHSLVFTANEANLKLKLSAEVNDPGVILIDDITLTATPEPVVGQITNGDFETGDKTGWETWQSTVISADAAYTGSYGANLKGNGSWGGFLNQSFNVEDGKTYQFSFWYKVNTSGTNWSLKGEQTGTNYGSGWVTAQAWTQATVDFVANGDTSIYLNFNGGGDGVAEDVYVDDVKLLELVDPSNDGFIVNGTFETGAAAPWTLYSGSNVSAEAAYTGNYGLHCTNPTGGWGGTAFQDFTVEVGKSYEVTMWAKAISQGQNIQVQNGGANVAGAWFNKTEWTLLTFEFTATATNTRINICGGGTSANEEVYFDDIKVKELIDPSFDGYIYNGDFETGEVFPWDNLWGSCPTVEIVEGGLDSNYALHIVSNKWNHVRQTAIAVEANTWYKVTAWAKNTSDMVLLVKDGADVANLNQTGMNAGDEWTEFTGVFNSGEYTSVIVSLMGGENDEIADKYGTFDNIVMEVTEAPCEHEYEYDCSKVCSLCGEETRPEAEHEYFYACDTYCMHCYEETNPDAEHSIVHVEAKDPVNCIEYGNKEYWYCEHCGAAWLDENLIRQTNMMSVRIAGECVSDAEFPCQDGVCINCGLPYAADEAHTYDNDYDATCNVCGDVREVEAPEIVYGDADGNGEVEVLDAALIQQALAGYEVTLNETAADADGNGEIEVLDAALIQQLLAGYDVTLGPVEG